MIYNLKRDETCFIKMKLSLHKYQYSISLEIKCNIDPRKQHYKITYWRDSFKHVSYSLHLEKTVLAYIAIFVRWKE